MENKYYTPKVEEFHVGFEIEVYNQSTSSWYKKVCTIESIQEDILSVYGAAGMDWTLDGEDENHPSCRTRVKYLDKADIEECGFTREFTTFSEILKAPTEVYISEDKNLMLAHYPDLNKVTITTRDFSKNKITSKHTWDDKQVNLLSVNNKTELIKLLKQLEINNYI